MHEPVAAIATVFVLGVAAQVVATRLRLPSILLLLTAAFAAGPVFGLLDPDDLLGDLLFPVVSLGVGVLLFEGGLSLHRSELGSWSGVLVRLLSVGALVSFVTATLAARFVGGLPTGAALVFGSIMTVTGPTVIIPLLRHARLRPRVGRVLRWEGICIDAVGATLAIVVLEVVVVGGDHGVGRVAREVATTAAAGVGVGLVGAYLLALVLGRRWVPGHLEVATILAAAVLAFAVADQLRPEAGLFSTTVFGVALANQRRAPVRHVRQFQETVGLLLIGGIFVLLGSRVEASDLTANLLPGLGVLAVLVLVSRPLAVAASTMGSSLTARERLFLAGIAPRGIVAASVSSLFALELERSGHPGGTDLAALTFLVVAGTVVVYGLGARPLAAKLRMSIPEPCGVAIVGAPPWAVEVGAALARLDVAVLVVATDEAEVRMARHADLLAYNGRLAHRDLEETVDAVGVRLALVVTDREELRAFAVDRFVELIGRERVFELPADGEPGGHGSAGGDEARPFGVGLDGRAVLDLIAEGATVTTLDADEATDRGGGFSPLVAVARGRPEPVVGRGLPKGAEAVVGIAHGAGGA